MESQHYIEPAREIPLMGTYDVIVCGGGPAGCAAALYSARHGARTLLIEREGYLGGAPCTQNVVPILSTNAMDFQGVWHEWARALGAYDGITPLHREPRCGTMWVAGSVDPEAVKMAWDDLLTEAQVQIFHFAYCVGAIVEDGAIRGLLIETKAGRRALRAERVVDCTGDGDACAAAGVPWEQGVAGAPWAMGVSLQSWYGGVPKAPDYKFGHINRVGRTGRSIGNLPFFSSGLQRHLRVNPLDPWDLSQVMRDGRREAWDRFRRKRSEAGCENLYLAGTSALPGVRSSRRIGGLEVSTEGDAFELRKYQDSVARSSWEIDIHSAVQGARKCIDYDDPDYLTRVRRTERGDFYDIRYGCIVAAEVDNILVGGRCISAEHESQASLRIQQTCMATGQAAGTAAALSLKHGKTPRELDPMVVVKQLEDDRAAVTPAFDRAALFAEEATALAAT